MSGWVPSSPSSKAVMVCWVLSPVLMVIALLRRLKEGASLTLLTVSVRDCVDWLLVSEESSAVTTIVAEPKASS